MTPPSPFLALVNSRLRAGRAPLPAFFGVRVRRDRVGASAPFVGVWFRTRGCTHDRQGECTVCNYGASSAVPAAEMVENVRAALERLPPGDDLVLYVSPSGSMFDDAEVPAAAREAIFALVRDTPGRVFTCETRLQYLNEERLARFAALLPHKERWIETGLESATPWVLALCLNKAVDLGELEGAMTLLHRHGVSCTANVMLGMPFLTAREAVEDAVATVDWALARGADRCSLFPLNVKRATLLEWLWREQLYSPPSLWSLVEVLLRLAPRVGPRLRLSWWYRDRSAGRAAGGASPAAARGGGDLVLAPPVTCPACHERVLEQLDVYRAQPGLEPLERLRALECACKDEWRARMTAPAAPRAARLAEAYERVGRGVLGPDWWAEHGAEVLAHLAATLPPPAAAAAPPLLLSLAR